MFILRATKFEKCHKFHTAVDYDDAITTSVEIAHIIGQEGIRTGRFNVYTVRETRDLIFSPFKNRFLNIYDTDDISVYVVISKYGKVICGCRTEYDNILEGALKHSKDFNGNTQHQYLVHYRINTLGLSQLPQLK